MRRLTTRKLLAGLAGVTVVAGGVAFATNALAQPNPNTTIADESQVMFSDDLPNPYEDARREARQAALEGVLNGTIQTEQRGASTVAKLADNVQRPGHNSKTQYVELARQTTDRIFVVLVEFGDTPNPYPTAPNATRTEGPLHNQIPQPNRAVDNSTVWQPDYTQAYFQNLYFGEGESLKHYYEAQSSGTYSVDGTVTDWVKVPYTEGRYGTDSCGSNVCSTSKFLIRDAANAWYADQLAQGRPKADVIAELKSFDQWDRYDLDQDGNFNEPDGFLDHFQIVHAGGDEADGDPIYGQDALWSHRWYTNLAYGPTCTDPDPTTLCITGTQIGDSGMWIGDYTLQPENGGRSVFYHEYGHDLGLPDDYDTSGAGDNNSEHWTLMAQSRLGAATDEGIGERAGDLGAWNKLQLGWLNYSAVAYNDHKTLQLGPQEYNSNLPQGLVVVLPPKQISYDAGAPAEGDKQWYSSHVDNSQFILTKSVTVPTNGHLTFQARYDIECTYDYAYVQVGTDEIDWWDGTSGIEDHCSEGAGEDWTSDQIANYGWVTKDYDLSAYAGQTVPLTFGYVTDPGVGGNIDEAPNGLFVDDVKVGGAAVGEDGWTANAGWELVGATYDKSFGHYYIAGYRSYTGYDQYLKTGPYFFGYNPTYPDKVDHYAYQEGLLISYWDTSQADNNTSEHPGVGLNMIIDSHPVPMAQASGPGGYWRARVQVSDAPFGIRTTGTVTLHVGGQPFTFGGLPGNPTFNDRDTYWYSQVPNAGVKLPGYGVKIQVLNDSAGKLQVKVN